MKRARIALKITGLLAVILAAVLGLASFSCSEARLGDDPLEVANDGEFWVDQEGKIVYALEGSVILEFPEGAVTEPTLFTVASFPEDQLEMGGFNMAKCGIILKSDFPGQKFAQSVHITLPYCTSDFKSATPVNEEDLTIFRIIPNVFASSISQCTVDCTWDMIHGCIDECGIYTVGQNCQ
jgi:hypothetical protein